MARTRSSAASSLAVQDTEDTQQSATKAAHPNPMPPPRSSSRPTMQIDAGNHQSPATSQSPVDESQLTTSTESIPRHDDSSIAARPRPKVPFAPESVNMVIAYMESFVPALVRITHNSNEETLYRIHQTVEPLHDALNLAIRDIRDQEMEAMEEENDKIKGHYQNLREDYDNLRENHDKLREDYDNLRLQVKKKLAAVKLHVEEKDKEIEMAKAESEVRYRDNMKSIREAVKREQKYENRIEVLEEQLAEMRQHYYQHQHRTRRYTPDGSQYTSPSQLDDVVYDHELPATHFDDDDDDGDDDDDDDDDVEDEAPSPIHQDYEEEVEEDEDENEVDLLPDTGTPTPQQSTTHRHHARPSYTFRATRPKHSRLSLPPAHDAVRLMRASLTSLHHVLDAAPPRPFPLSRHRDRRGAAEDLDARVPAPPASQEDKECAAARALLLSRLQLRTEGRMFKLVEIPDEDQVVRGLTQALHALVRTRGKAERALKWAEGKVGGEYCLCGCISTRRRPFFERGGKWACRECLVGGRPCIIRDAETGAIVCLPREPESEKLKWGNLEMWTDVSQGRKKRRRTE